MAALPSPRPPGGAALPSHERGRPGMVTLSQGRPGGAIDCAYDQVTVW